MIGQLRNLPPKPTADRVDGLLRLFSLHGDRNVPISSYSKGIRQKVLLSAALLHNLALGPFLLVSRPLPSVERIDASGARPTGEAGVVGLGRRRVRKRCSVHVLLSVHPPPDRGGTGHHSPLKQLQLVGCGPGGRLRATRWC